MLPLYERVSNSVYFLSRHRLLNKETSMFDSLSDRIKQDEDVAASWTERLVRWAVVIVLSVLLFGGLYFVVRWLG